MLQRVEIIEEMKIVACRFDVMDVVNTKPPLAVVFPFCRRNFRDTKLSVEARGRKINILAYQCHWFSRVKE